MIFGVLPLIDKTSLDKTKIVLISLRKTNILLVSFFPNIHKLIFKWLC